MNNIILGVFYNEQGTFQKLKDRTLSESFVDFEDFKPTAHFCVNSVLNIVHLALVRCEICHFDLSAVKLELESDSFRKYTLMELHLVITTPEFLDKTIFYQNGEVMKKETVINWFLFDKYWNQFL